MISNQETFNLDTYKDIYIVPQANMTLEEIKGESGNNVEK